MFVATSSTINNNNHPPSYIVASTTTTTTTTTTTASGIDTTNNTNAQTLSDIKLICIQRKKRNKRHIYLTFVETRPLSSSTDQPHIEIIPKSSSSSSSQTLTYFIK